MPTTSKGLRYPASSAAPNVPQDIQNLATDVNTALPGAWVTPYTSDTVYLFSPTTLDAWTTMPSVAATTPVVPVGRELEVEFTAPICNPAAGFMYVRLTTGGVQRAINGFSAGWGPVTLTWSQPGTGAAVALLVQCNASTIDADVRAAGGGVLRLRYRIV